MEDYSEELLATIEAVGTTPAQAEAAAILTQLDALINPQPRVKAMRPDGEEVLGLSLEDVRNFLATLVQLRGSIEIKVSEMLSVEDPSIYDPVFFITDTGIELDIMKVGEEE